MGNIGMYGILIVLAAFINFDHIEPQDILFRTKDKIAALSAAAEEKEGREGHRLRVQTGQWVLAQTGRSRPRQGREVRGPEENRRLRIQARLIRKMFNAADRLRAGKMPVAVTWAAGLVLAISLLLTGCSRRPSVVSVPAGGAGGGRRDRDRLDERGRSSPSRDASLFPSTVRGRAGLRPLTRSAGPLLS